MKILKQLKWIWRNFETVENSIERGDSIDLDFIDKDEMPKMWKEN